MVVGFAAVAAPAYASPPDPDLVAHFTFDEGGGTVLHDRAGQREHARILGGAWVRSRRGAALDLAGSGERVDCGDAPHTRLPGPLTVVFWVRRCGTVQQYVVERGGWNVYLLPDGSPVFETRTAANDAWDALAAPAAPAAGGWAHIAAVYDTDRAVMELHVNGRCLASKPRRDGAIGGLFRSKLVLGRELDGLLGEFRLYRRALTATEVLGLFRTTAPDPALAPLPYRLRVVPRLFLAEGTVAAEVAVTRAPAGSAGQLAGAVALRQADAKRPRQTRLLSSLPLGRRTDVTFATRGLPPGQYEVVATAHDARGRTVATAMSRLALPKRPWWYRSTAGRSSRVFAPFTPLRACRQAGQLAISCWNRTCRVGGLALPERVVSAGRELLAGPVRLAGLAGGKALSWATAAPVLDKASPAEVVFRGRGSARGLTLRATGRMDYDGLLRVEASLTPRRPVRLERLQLEVPLKREHARLVYFHRDQRYMASGALPADGVLRDFNPAIWLGDEQRGLQWLCESDRDWRLADASRAVEIAPEGEAVVLRLHLVTAPLTLAPGAPATTTSAPFLSYTFGFHPTPVKPLSEGAWDHRVTTGHAYGREYAMLTDRVGGQTALDFCARRGVRTLIVFNWTDVLSYPAPIGHEADLCRLVKACHARRLKVLLYLGCQFSELAPEYVSFAPEFLAWTSAVPFSTYGYLDNYPPARAQMTYSPCPQSEWRSFILANAERLLKRYNVDGFYLDGIGTSSACYNPHHGCGFRHPDGTIHPRYPLWAARNAVRRLYQMVRLHKPDGQVDLHPAGCWSAATVAWATTVWDGETILGEERKGAGPGPGTFLLDTVPLPMFRAQLMGRPWGVSTEFIHYYSPNPEMEQLALALLHDVTIRAHVTPGWLDFMASLWNLADRFGRKEAQWLPYWRNRAYVAVTPAGTDDAPAALASLYRHPRNGVLAVIANLGRSEADVEARLNLPRLGLHGGAAARDALSGQPIPLESGAIRLPRMPSLSWRLVWVKPQGATTTPVHGPRPIRAKPSRSQ